MYSLTHTQSTLRIQHRKYISSKQHEKIFSATRHRPKITQTASRAFNSRENFSAETFSERAPRENFSLPRCDWSALGACGICRFVLHLRVPPMNCFRSRSWSELFCVEGAGRRWHTHNLRPWAATASSAVAVCTQILVSADALPSGEILLRFFSFFAQLLCDLWESELLLCNRAVPVEQAGSKRKFCLEKN